MKDYQGGDCDLPGGHGIKAGIPQKGHDFKVVGSFQGNIEMRNALGILELTSQGEEEIRAGKARLQAEVFADLERRLKEKSERDDTQFPGRVSLKVCS